MFWQFMLTHVSKFQPSSYVANLMVNHPEEKMCESNQSIQYIEFSAGKSELIDSRIATEQAVSLSVNGEVWITFMCTPFQLEELAIGFLYNEGIINDYKDIASIRCCPSRENIDVWLNFNVGTPKEWRRTSGCTGGFTSITETTENYILHPAIQNGNSYTPKELCDFVIQLLESQEIYSTSGGVHSSALSDGTKLRIVAEDIGRHNTLDKISGILLRSGEVFPKRILLTTGRISSEMLQKAYRIGASIVISRTSPTSLSIDIAEKWGITLIGYARRNSFRIYTHPERVRRLALELVNK